MQFKRVFLIVLDSLGVGEAVDAINYNDSGSNTLGHINEKCDLFIPNLKKFGFLNTMDLQAIEDPEAYYTIAKPKNAGKDTINGLYEMMGVSSSIPFKTFNEGFPIEILTNIERITERKVIGNKCSNDDYIIN